jgi:hypothetical protein
MASQYPMLDMRRANNSCFRQRTALRRAHFNWKRSTAISFSPWKRWKLIGRNLLFYLVSRILTYGTISNYYKFCVKSIWKHSCCLYNRFYAKITFSILNSTKSIRFNIIALTFCSNDYFSYDVGTKLSLVESYKSQSSILFRMKYFRKLAV